MRTCSANQHQVVMPSLLPKVSWWLRKNALRLSQSAFSNFAPDVITGIIRVSVRVSFSLWLITHTSTLLILDITKASSNDCLISSHFERTSFLDNKGSSYGKYTVFISVEPNQLPCFLKKTLTCRFLYFLIVNLAKTAVYFYVITGIVALQSRKAKKS